MANNKLLTIEKPEVGRRVVAILKHADMWQTATPELIAVDEPDCDWRFVDGSELSYDWDVVYLEYK